jgi:hypothetical protein
LELEQLRDSVTSAQHREAALKLESDYTVSELQEELSRGRQVDQQRTFLLQTVEKEAARVKRVSALRQLRQVAVSKWRWRLLTAVTGWGVAAREAQGALEMARLREELEAQERRHAQALAKQLEPLHTELEAFPLPCTAPASVHANPRNATTSPIPDPHPLASELSRSGGTTQAFESACIVAPRDLG